MDARLVRIPRLVAVAITLAFCGIGLVATGAAPSLDAVNDSTADDSREVRSDDAVMIDNDPLRTDAEFLASARGIDLDVMEEYLRLELELVSLAEQIDSAHRSEIAGIWIDWRPEPVLVVRLRSDTALGAVEAISEPLDSHVEVEVVEDEHSREEKIGLLFTLRQDLALLGFEQMMTHLDDRSGDLVVTIPIDETHSDLLTRTVGEYAAVNNLSIRIDTADAFAHVAGRDVQGHSVPPSVHGVAGVFHAGVAAARQHSGTTWALHRW